MGSLVAAVAGDANLVVAAAAVIAAAGAKDDRSDPIDA